MTTDTAHSGVREIDTGELPDRYARGWHCLGTVKDFRDGKPPRSRRSARSWWSSPIPQGRAQGSRRLLPAHGRRPVPGTIKGDEIACPFHDWRWGGDGKCKLVPYAKRTPAGPHPCLAHRRPRWPAVRLARPRGQPAHRGRPYPEIPEWAGGEWTDWKWNTMLIEGSNCRDHRQRHRHGALLLHPLQPADVLQERLRGPHRVAVPAQRRPARHQRHGHRVRRGQPGLRASYFGPSFMINWLHNKYGDFKAESILINCHYPVNQNSFVLQWGVIVEKPRGSTTPPPRSRAVAFTEGVSKRGFPAGRGDLEAQDPHRQPAAGGGGRRRLPDAPLVPAVLCRRGRRDRGDDRPLRTSRSTPPRPSRSGTSRFRRISRTWPSPLNRRNSSPRHDAAEEAGTQRHALWSTGSPGRWCSCTAATMTTRTTTTTARTGTLVDRGRRHRISPPIRSGRPPCTRPPRPIGSDT